MKIEQVFLILAITIGCANVDGTSTNPSSSHFFNRKLLRHIKSYIDAEANPCDDFYQYACGNWPKRHSISYDEEVKSNSYTSAVGKANYELNMELGQYLNGMGLRNKPEFVQKAHAFYKSCVKTDLDLYEFSYFMDWMQENENMTWALLSTPQDENDKFDWVYRLATMRRYGMNGIFIEEGVYGIFDDSRKSIIGLDKPTAKGGFTGLTYENFKTVDKHLTLPEDTKPLLDLWDEFSAFEKLLENLNDVPDEAGIQYISVKYIPFAWLHKYLGIVLNQNLLDLNMEVQFQNIAYMKALETLLEGYDDEFICRYLEVRFLWHLYQTPQEFSDEVCTGPTRGILSMPMNWIYEQQHPELKKEIPRIQEIFDNIVRQINMTMRSDKSGLITQQFFDKLDTIQLKVGNLPRIDTVQVLDAFYARLTLDRDDFYGNILKLSEFYFNATHTGFGNYLKTNISEMFYIDNYNDGANYLPYYLPTPNVVIAPLTLMRQPFYHWGYDDVYKYSTLGNRFAFIIIKGIMETCDIASEDLQKIVEITGLYCAYQAYYSLLPENLKDDQFIKGSQVVFFLNNAQLHCDAHEPYDLNPYVSHFPEFSQAFDCKLKNALEMFVHHSSND